MRKVFTILTIGLLVSSGLLAQKKKMHYKVDYGLQIGLNATHFNLKNLRDQNLANYSDSWKSGFVLGGFMNFALHKGFSIQPLFVYSQMGGNYVSNTGENVEARYNFFSFPILLRYTWKKWAVIAGPQFDLLIQGKEQREGGGFKVSDNLKDNDFILTGGFEYWFTKHVFGTVRYMKGFNDVDFRADMIRYYQEGLQFTLGIKFN